jgi:dTDP-4-dehydrorhamnose reductase
VTSSGFQTFVIGAEQPVGQYLARSLNAQGLMYKSIALESRDKLPVTPGGRPFFVIVPTLQSESFAHAAYWLDRAREIDACVVLISSLMVFEYQAGAVVTEDTCEFAENESAQALLKLEDHARQTEQHLILRIGQLFSLQGDDFASQLLTQARQQLQVDVDMQRLFDPTPADDVADVILAIIRQLVCSDDLFGTYHFSGVEPVSAYAFAEVIMAQAGQFEDLSELELKSQEGGMMPELWSVCSDNTLLFHTFGIKEKAWRQSVGRLLKRYYRVDESTQS